MAGCIRGDERLAWLAKRVSEVKPRLLVVSLLTSDSLTQWFCACFKFSLHWRLTTTLCCTWTSVIYRRCIQFVDFLAVCTCQIAMYATDVFLCFNSRYHLPGPRQPIISFLMWDEIFLSPTPLTHPTHFRVSKYLQCVILVFLKSINQEPSGLPRILRTRLHYVDFVGSDQWWALTNFF